MHLLYVMILGEGEISNVESIEINLPEAEPTFFWDFNWIEIFVIAGIVGTMQIILTITLLVALKSGPITTKKKKQ